MREKIVINKETATFTQCYQHNNMQCVRISVQCKCIAHSHSILFLVFISIHLVSTFSFTIPQSKRKWNANKNKPSTVICLIKKRQAFNRFDSSIIIIFIIVYITHRPSPAKMIYNDVIVANATNVPSLRSQCPIEPLSFCMHENDVIRKLLSLRASCICHHHHHQQQHCHTISMDFFFILFSIILFPKWRMKEEKKNTENKSQGKKWER